MSAGLSGVRVVDFGHYIAGPMAALLLADGGADVVHVDAPGTSSMGVTDAFLHRGKRRVTLDLKHAGDLETARALIAGADVVVENFRPGVMERLGVGPAASLAADPRLVYCSLPGFAADDEHAHLRAWEGIVHAAAAGYRPLEEHWDPTGRHNASVRDRAEPLYTPITTASNFGALLGATLVVAALIARERTGRGQRIELPLVEAMTEAYSTMLGRWIFDDDAPISANLMLRDLSYRCADGGMIDLSPYPKFVIPLLKAAGVAQDWEQRGLIDLAANTFLTEARDRIQDEFRALVLTRPAQEWDDIGLLLRTPVSMVRTPAQWLSSVHARESGAVVELDDAAHGTVVMPGSGFDLVDSPIQLVAAHSIDQDRDGVLAWARRDAAAGPSAAGTDAAPRLVRPLDGVRAIDMTQAVAGPTAARLLADLGADVIKIGSPTPAVTDGIVAQLHRGKRTILLDTRAAEGRDILDRLVRGADVLVTNFTAPAARKYSLDHDSLRVINPDLVYCSITAYGQSGPWAARRAYENQCNAATGMSWAYGSPFGWTLYQATPINDAATGILGALATVVALFERACGGRGQKVGASLAQASTWHQATTIVGAPADAAEQRGRGDAHGLTALYRLYRASDRSFFMVVWPAELSRLTAGIGVNGDDAMWSTWRDPSGALADALAQRFAGETADHWVSKLGALGVDALPVHAIDEAAAYLAARGVVYFEPDADGDWISRPGVGAWLSETPPTVGVNPGPVGSQAAEILHEVGLTDAEIEDLASAGIVRLPDDLPRITMRA